MGFLRKYLDTKQVQENQQPSLLDYKAPAPALSVEIQLSESEIQQGSFVGMQRSNYVIQQRLRQQKGYKDPWENSIEGALAEMAFARAMNLYWDGKLYDLTKGDVGFWEIRQTKHLEGKLRIKPSDNGDAPFVLVTGECGHYFVRGWIYGFEGKQHKYWQDIAKQNRFSFWVPQSDLRPIQTHIDFPTAHQGDTT